MNKDFLEIFQSIKQKKYAPVYVIDGEESFYLDKVSHVFEEEILTASEKDFNLTVIYGKDAEVTEVLNACRRYPMFAEWQVVILKDAGQMKKLNELEPYIENPTPTTILLIEHRFKKVDGRSKLLKTVKQKGMYATADKVKEEKLPEWIMNYGVETGFHVPEREAQLLAAYLGNDLQKIANEIEKIHINVPEEKQLTGDLIQKYIGISRDYNVFELPTALTNKKKEKLYRMLSYFLANPKAAPMPLLIGAFYSHFNTVFKIHAYKGKSEYEIKQSLKLYGDRLKENMTAAHNLASPKLEQCMVLLANYSAKTVGIASLASGGELLKEMVGKMELVME